MAENRRTTGADRPGGEPRQPGPDWRLGGASEDWAAFDDPAGTPPPRPRRGAPDLAPLFVLLDALRRLLPRELQAQFTSLLREVLLTLRALIDWYLERLDGRRREPPVEDIPIE